MIAEWHVAQMKEKKIWKNQRLPFCMLIMKSFEYLPKTYKNQHAVLEA